MNCGKILETLCTYRNQACFSFNWLLKKSINPPNSGAMFFKGIFSDSNNISLWHEWKSFKFCLIMCDSLLPLNAGLKKFLCMRLSLKIALKSHTEMISGYFFFRKFALKKELQKYAQNSNFENFYSTSESITKKYVNQMCITWFFSTISLKMSILPPNQLSIIFCDHSVFCMKNFCDIPSFLCPHLPFRTKWWPLSNQII